MHTEMSPVTQHVTAAWGQSLEHSRHPISFNKCPSWNNDVLFPPLRHPFESEHADEVRACLCDSVP